MTEAQLFDPGEPVDPSAVRSPCGGYAAPPGTGPDGETCKTCEHYAIVQFSRRYRKCGLIRKRWTPGPGTDIKAGSPACHYWTRRSPNP